MDLEYVTCIKKNEPLREMLLHSDMQLLEEILEKESCTLQGIQKAGKHGTTKRIPDRDLSGAAN